MRTSLQRRGALGSVGSAARITAVTLPQCPRPFSRPRYPHVVAQASPSSDGPASPQLPQGALSREGLLELVRQADGDGDGRLTVEEVAVLLQRVQGAPVGLPPPPPPPPPPGPASWELHIAHHTLAALKGTHATAVSSPFTSGTNGAGKGGVTGIARALSQFLQLKLSNRHKNRVILSDLVWTFCGVFAAWMVLGAAAAHVKTWPLVGQWHQRGLGLLLGSFGTISVLLFARPESEPIKVWNILAGHVFSIVIVLLVIQVMGTTPVARATAMGLAIATMLYTDCVHPPGGALVLLAVDSPVVQAMGPAFLLYPSLLFCAAVMLPLGAMTNWLKRNVRFGMQAAAAGTGVTWPSPAPQSPYTSNGSNSGNGGSLHPKAA